MKAVVWSGLGQIDLEDVAGARLEQSTDAVVRLTMSAICGTDLHMVRGTMPGKQPGTVLGHEGVGVVEVVGSQFCGSRGTLPAAGFGAPSPRCGAHNLTGLRPRLIPAVIAAHLRAPLGDRAAKRTRPDDVGYVILRSGHRGDQLDNTLGCHTASVRGRRGRVLLLMVPA
jgi:hypothetical protein